MHMIFQRPAKRHRGITGILLVAVFLAAGSAQAGNSWLDKGTDLLKTVTGSGRQTDITAEAIGAGLKDALLVGSEQVVSRLGKVNGFDTNSAVHIPLPKQLDTVKSALGKIGMSGPLQDLELKLNRAAEVATPKAKRLFRQAIAEMKFDDVKAIYEGPQNAATQYFRGRMSPLPRTGDAACRQEQPCKRGGRSGLRQRHEEISSHTLCARGKSRHDRLCR